MMSAPCQQGMEDQRSTLTHIMEQEEQFTQLEGAGPSLCDQEAWPIIGKQNNQVCRINCCCMQYGTLGEVMDNLVCQAFCLKVNFKPEFKFSIVTGIPCLADENFCKYQLICCEYGMTKFRPGCQYFCCTCGSTPDGDAPQIAPVAA